MKGKMTMKVGFIGLGIMGKPMSKNLLKKGYELHVYDINLDSMKEIEEAGGHRHGSGKEVAQHADVVVLMLPNSPHVEEALFGKDGLAEGLEPGKAVIDMSSIDPIESRKFGQRLSDMGVDFLDAPVSGGEPGAIAGTISVMVGGPEAVFDKYYDLMKAMSGSVVRCGDVGAGNITKCANQMIVAANIAAVGEALVFAKQAGVDPNLVFNAIRGGLAGSAVMEAKGPMMLEHNTKPGFRIALHLKDLNNVLSTAQGIGCLVPLTQKSMEVMKNVAASGHLHSDHSALAHYFESLNEVEL